MKVTAVDVSFCQTNVDYHKVKADGIDTVIIRAGFGRETYQKDAQFEEHYKMLLPLLLRYLYRVWSESQAPNHRTRVNQVFGRSSNTDKHLLLFSPRQRCTHN